MHTTFPQLLLNHASQRPLAPAMREKEYGIWQALSWADLATLVDHIACGLHQAGLRRNEHMVVVGANRPRLYATMLAVQSLGRAIAPKLIATITATAAETRKLTGSPEQKKNLHERIQQHQPDRASEKSTGPTC